MKLYDTLSRDTKEFSPQKPPIVTMYACGPTVYDDTHIGHMRKYTGDDILRRTLSLFGYDVNHVMNITDVGHLTDDGDAGEDKLEKGAAKSGQTVWEIADHYTKRFLDTMSAVNVLPATHLTKATDHIAEMIALNEKLTANGFTYETDQALYFDTSKDAEYGKLSGQKLSEKETGVRDDVVVDTDKKNPADFVLWFKRVGKFADHTMHWPSPWGDGFPGWHIECSAMSMQYLGETIDIHTGGIDHIPVHHENEIAQSECATGHPFVKYWVHYAFLQVDGEKMSKSKQNGYTIDDIREKNINPLALRLLFMQTHYRKPLNFTWESAQGAQTSFDRLHAFAVLHHDITIDTVAPSEQYLDSFKEALGDDLNTAKALAVVWQLLSDKTVPIEQKKKTLFAFDEVLGLDLKNIEPIVIPEHVTTLLKERSEARAQKNWQVSDQLRTEIEKSGFTVIDTEDGSIAQKI